MGRLLAVLLALGVLALLAPWGHRRPKAAGPGAAAVEPAAAPVEPSLAEATEEPSAARPPREAVVEAAPEASAYPRPVFVETATGENLSALVQRLGYLAPPILEVRAVPGEEALGQVPAKEVLAHFERFEPRDHYGGESRQVGELHEPRQAPAYFALVLEDRVVAHLPGEAPELRFQLSAENLQAVFGAVTAKLVGSEGRAPEQGNVELRLPWSGTRGQTLSGARLDLRGLAPGPQRLTLHVAGFVTQELRFELQPGEQHDLGAIELQPSRSVAGRVEGPRGQDWRVLLLRLDELGTGFVVRETRDVATDEDGAFSFVNLAPDLYALRVGRRLHHRKILPKRIQNEDGTWSTGYPDFNEDADGTLTRDGPMAMPSVRGLRPMLQFLGDGPTSPSVLVDLRARSQQGVRLDLMEEARVTFHCESSKPTSVSVLDEHGIHALDFGFDTDFQELAAFLAPGTYRLVVTRGGHQQPASTFVVGGEAVRVRVP